MIHYMTIPEAARLWQLTPCLLRQICERKQIAGAVRFGSKWLIPEQAERPGTSL